jgi:hypothetical protein
MYVQPNVPEIKKARKLQLFHWLKEDEAKLFRALLETKLSKTKAIETYYL